MTQDMLDAIEAVIATVNSRHPATDAERLEAIKMATDFLADELAKFDASLVRDIAID